MAVEKKNSINEHIDRIKFVSNYQLNEAKYTLVDGLEEDDGVPEEIWSEPNSVSPLPVREDEPQMDNEGLPVEEPVAPEASEMNPEAPMPDDSGVEMGMEAPMEQPIPEPEPPSVDEIQNDILKTSVTAMQKMNDQLTNLENTLGSLNQKMDGLDREVEQVREPTNVEKLVARKEDSHPFYMNLNDMWDGNSFQARTEIEDSHGIKKLDDGSFVADFDSLPKYNEQEIKDSF